MLFSDSVETLKTQYTDKYVKVDARRPELARFRDAVGQVKTVNMNGRALVQFLDYHLNTGWFDIDLACLTVVDPPPKDVTAKPEAKRAHDTPTGKAAPTAGDKQIADAKAPAGGGGEKKLSPLEMARMQGAGGKAAAAAPAKPAGEAAGPAKKSTADILAAARGGAAAAPATPAAKPAGGGKPSTADILAAARGKASAPVAAETPAPAAAPKAEAPTLAAPTPTPAPAAPAAGGIVRVDKSTMTVAQMVEYCRTKDAK
jgi:hypothetical protein